MAKLNDAETRLVVDALCSYARTMGAAAEGTPAIAQHAYQVEEEATKLAEKLARQIVG